MVARSQLVGVSWTLGDQAVVSLGTFLLNILLARQLAAGDYGTFALLYGILLTLQIFTGSLLYYPLAVRLSVAPPDQRRRLMGATFILTGLMCVLLGAILATIVIALGRIDLLLPVLLFLVLWQMQEAARRGLMALFRHRNAVSGDALSYLGQVAGVLALGLHGSLSLMGVFYIMAVTAGLGAVLHARQVDAALPSVAELRRSAVDFWSVGYWSLANNLISNLRVQVFPWVLALLHGPAAVAYFQAALNVANLPNPVVIGLCNLIPQTVAQAHARGKRQAWLAARAFARIGAAPTFLYCAIGLVVPSLMLQLLYGSTSSYLDVVTPVRLLLVAWLVNYAADMACAYFHGVEIAKRAFVVNAFGASAAVVLAIPLTMALGLVGSCIALVLASAARLATSQTLLVRTIAHDQRHVA